VDVTIRYRAEKTLENFNLSDDDLGNVIQEWAETPMPEGCSPDYPIVVLEKIAFRYMLKSKGLWEQSRAYRITYPLPKEE